MNKAEMTTYADKKYSVNTLAIISRKEQIVECVFKR